MIPVGGPPAAEVWAMSLHRYDLREDSVSPVLGVYGRLAAARTDVLGMVGMWPPDEVLAEAEDDGYLV